jgi:hypothetical protein
MNYIRETSQHEAWLSTFVFTSIALVMSLLSTCPCRLAGSFNGARSGS